ncbi:MAG: Gfo/Idh/MocA family oxidoreductase [Acidimicrobiales bacterium]
MPAPLPSDRPVRWGILATGKISATLVDEIRRSPDCEIVAVGSRNEDSARRFAAAHGIATTYGSYDALIEDEGVDVVYVGASHGAHYAAVRHCIEVGRAVLCEKPFTVDASQTEELVRLARAADVFVMEAMWMRCRPGFADLAAVLASGEIGEVRHVRAALGFVPTAAQAPRLFDPGQAGGALLDVGVYPITLAFATLGEPEEIRALGHVEGGVDRTTVVAMSWPTGATGVLSATIEAEIDTTAAFSGSKGRVEIAAPFHGIPSLSVTAEDGTARRVEPHAEGIGYVHEIAEVVRCLRAGVGESPLVPLDESIAIMRILDECRSQIGLTYPDTVYR